MQKFLDELISKVLWMMLGFILLLAGYNYLVSNLIKPPKLASNSNQSPNKHPSNYPNHAARALPTSNPEPEPILKVPRKLEKGGILKIYQNIDRNIYPNPLRYTPNQVIETDGLELTSLEKDSHFFQEVSGYFKVAQDGDYNFILNTPKTWDKENLEINKLSIKIDGYILELPTGGKIYLEKGWHKIAIFSQQEIAGEYPSLSWQEVGQVVQAVKPVQVWRETKETTN